MVARRICSALSIYKSGCRYAGEQLLQKGTVFLIADEMAATYAAAAGFHSTAQEPDGTRVVISRSAGASTHGPAGLIWKSSARSPLLRSRRPESEQNPIIFSAFSFDRQLGQSLLK